MRKNGYKENGGVALLHHISLKKLLTYIGESSYIIINYFGENYEYKTIG
tara:strand:+ start:222 stop:368 length:147 start_codon:yes stop_codon:yes gene_type:complete